MFTRPSAASRRRNSATTATPRCFSAWRIVSGIEHRYSFLSRASGAGQSLHRRRRLLPARSISRHRRAHAPFRAARARAGAGTRSSACSSAPSATRITHLLVTCCTGFSAPGARSRADRALRPAERGRAHHDRLHGLLCGDQRAQARAPHRALGAAARVLILNLELCTLHLQGDHRSRADAVLPALRRRLRRVARHRRAGRHRARQFPRGAGARTRAR